MVDSERLLNVDLVRKHFSGFAALSGVSLSVDSGEVVAIVGPSGSGKSTLLRCIGLLEQIDGGVISLRDETIGTEYLKGHWWRRKNSDIMRQRRYFGMVFQSFNLFPHLTAIQNVMAGLIYVKKFDRKKAREIAEAALMSVGLSDRRDHYAEQLSGGQQQRVAIARAIATAPEVLLFDEPTSALDPELVNEVLSVMRRLANDGNTMIVVTHEIGFARNVADRVIFMDKGSVVEQGPAKDVIDNPQTERCQNFLKSIG